MPSFGKVALVASTGYIAAACLLTFAPKQTIGYLIDGLTLVGVVGIRWLHSIPGLA